MTKKELEDLFFNSSNWGILFSGICNSCSYIDKLNLQDCPLPLPKKRCFPEHGLVEFYRYNSQVPNYALVFWRGFNYTAEIYLTNSIGGAVSGEVFVNKYFSKTHVMRRSFSVLSTTNTSSLYKIIISFIEYEGHLRENN